MSFLPDAHTLALYTVACIILFITPGPDMSLWLSKTLSGGRQSGIAAMAGTSVGCLVHTVLVAVGISALLKASVIAFTALKIGGALYLLWLGIDAIRNGSALSVGAVTKRDANLRADFLTGLGINLTNPKVVLFFVTFLPQFVSATDPAAAQKLLFLGSYFVLFNVPLSIALILIAERFIEWLRRRPFVLRVIDFTFAGIFGYFAYRILTTEAH